MFADPQPLSGHETETKPWLTRASQRKGPGLADDGDGVANRVAHKRSSSLAVPCSDCAGVPVKHWSVGVCVCLRALVGASFAAS